MITVVLVTGGRRYADEAHFNAQMDAIAAHYGNLLVVQGGCLSGADMLAIRWADRKGVHYATVPALWHRHSKAAGPKRNSAMLALQPAVCVVFPGGAGTADMAAKARAAGVPTYEV